MMISRLEGGLGNQMFQYAFGWYAAKAAGVELKLDLSSYRSQPQHGYLLNKFRIKAESVSEADIHRIPRRYRASNLECSQADTNSKRHWLLDLMHRGGRLKRFKEKPFGFDAKYLMVPDQSYLVGNWQSEQFFPGIRDDLLAQFQLKDTPSRASREVVKRIANTRSLSVHIRRGDYITDASAASIYQNLSLAYYRKCVKEFAERGERPTLFVFSNDLKWCRRELNLPFETHFVDHCGPDTAYEDMWLMSQCAGSVIANSTFSWWAAWLNQRPGKQVFAPELWFRRGELDDRSINCSDWTEMPIVPDTTPALSVA